MTHVAKNLGLLTGFAGDKAVFMRHKGPGERIINCVQRILDEIGLGINSQKRMSLITNKGELQEAKLSLENGDVIKS